MPEIIYDGNSATVYIDGPVTITAKLEKNYSLLIGVIIIPIVVGGFIVGKKFKRRPIVVSQTVETVEETPKKNIQTSMMKNSPAYLADKITETR